MPRSSRKTGPLKLPDFIGVGPSRTGSTWLYNALRDSVDMPAGAKDTHFYHNLYDKGLDWYADHFRYATGERKIVEICPGAFFRPLTPERIKADIPNCKIFATIRNPVDRIHSVYKLQRHYGVIRKTLDQMLVVFPDLGGGNRYASLLKKWFDLFGRENVLVTNFDELRNEPQKYLNRVTDFMDVERISLADRNLTDDANAFTVAPKSRKLARRATSVLNWLNGHQAYGVVDALGRAGVWEFCHGRGEPFAPLSPEQEASLRQRYLPEVEALEELLKIDLSAWKKPRAPRNLKDAPRTQLSSTG